MFFIGICVHLVFLVSIYDIYLKSPIVKNVTPYQPLHEALADRLILFVVDGLRADSLVNYTTMKYLRSVANSHGRWGISNTRVPTESRPGHVAVIAGFYEDPSAVFKGWKENPVDFDSVFNQTTYTWCWGSYDIVEIFTKGSMDDHIILIKFNPHEHEFSTNENTTLLDAWVFDNVKQLFFHSAEKDEIMYERLLKKKIVFFLHLLGTDTSGHTHKPETENYYTTLRFVDNGIREIEKVIRDFYHHDGRTTFLMTSDHGMTDWGSHGAGDNHETQTPYVLWGAGVHEIAVFQPDPATNNMSSEHRLDINQTDLAPLMSTILSIPVPVNSVGQLPIEVLNMSLADKAKAMYSNSRQLASQYYKKRMDVEARALPQFYHPYEPFSIQKYEEFIRYTEKLLKNEEYDRLILNSKEIIQLSRSGLNYYNNYYQRALLILVTISFVGWIAFLLKVIIDQNIHTQVEASVQESLKKKHNWSTLALNVSFSMLILIACSFVYVQDFPLTFYLYVCTPIYIWWSALIPINVWIKTYKQLTTMRGILQVLIESLCYTFGSLAMGLSFTYRWMLSIPLVGMGLWPYFSSTRGHISKPILLIWSTSCILLSLFTFMPIVHRAVFIELVLAAGCIWLVVLGIYLWKVLRPLYREFEETQWKVLLPSYQEFEETKQEIILTIKQFLLLLISLHNIYVQSKRFENGTPVSSFYQAAAWTIVVLCFVNLLSHSKRLVCRLLAIDTALLNFYLFQSVAHEGLFMVTLIFNVTCWILIEVKLLHLEKIKITECFFDKENIVNNSKSFSCFKRGISSQDFRRAFFFTLYIILAFFGTGNIASLNSFQVRWVTCFITSYQPAIIATLILLKTLSPFLVIACGFRAVQHLTKAPTGYLNTIILLYSNIMAIRLLYYVKNTGSWLEIGTSISQFVIVQLIILFMLLINQIAKVLTNVNINNIVYKIFGRKKVV